MKKDIARTSSVPSVRMGLISQETGEGFKEVFPYQNRIFGRILWTSKNSIVRIVPGNDGNKTFPQVINADVWSQDADQTEFLPDTFYMTQTLSNFGDSHLDVCANLKPGTDDAARYPESPLAYFCNKIHRTMRAVNQGKATKVRYNERWRTWTSMQGCLPFPKTTLFFQAICFNLCDRQCTKSQEDPEPAPLFGVIGINNRASIESLMNALIQPMDRRKPIGSSNNNHGPLAELEGNILFLNTAMDSENHRYLQASIQHSEAPAGTWEPTGYDLDEDTCMKLWVPWDKVLRYLTVEEQLNLIASEFGCDTLNYVFSLSSQWNDLAIPEHIAAVGLGSYDPSRTQVTAKGYGKASSLSQEIRTVSKASTVSGAPGMPKFNTGTAPGMPKFDSDGFPGPGTPKSVKASKPAPSGLNIADIKATISSISGNKPKAGGVADALLEGIELPDDDVYEATGEEPLGIE